MQRKALRGNRIHVILERHRRSLRVGTGLHVATRAFGARVGQHVLVVACGCGPLVGQHHVVLEIGQQRFDGSERQPGLAADSPAGSRAVGEQETAQQLLDEIATEARFLQRRGLARIETGVVARPFCAARGCDGAERAFVRCLSLVRGGGEWLRESSPIRWFEVVVHWLGGCKAHRSSPAWCERRTTACATARRLVRPCSGFECRHSFPHASVRYSGRRATERGSRERIRKKTLRAE